jgi:ribose transport system substrate-binding protein
LAENDDLDCVFVAWDLPALKVLSAIREGAKPLPIVTVDLGNEIAAELPSGGPFKGIAAQRPYDRGRRRAQRSSV